jgi:hypothetical protein
LLGGARPLLGDAHPVSRAPQAGGGEAAEDSDRGEERSTVADVLLEPERFSLRDAVGRTDWGV